MFRVKICGITRAEDARAAAEAGADAIGLNFYSASKRYCPPERAKEIASETPAWVCKVGVFVGATAEEIRRICRQVPLDVIQLHGDETPELLRTLRPLPLIKALPFAGTAEPIAEFLLACHQQQALPRMLLVDAATGGRFGGTGEAIDWSLFASQRPKLSGMPLILAGGLTPDNVATAIRATHPWAVDVASGVESAPGKKSPELVRAFVAQAHQAFAAR